VGRGRVARLIDVAGYDDQVDVVGKGTIDRLVEGVQEILQAAREPRRGVDPPVVFHPDVDVGEMQELDHCSSVGAR